MSHSMTIATWNTNGPVRYHGKHAHLAAIEFDAAAVQECEEQPLGGLKSALSRPLQHGSGVRCISILSPHRLQKVPGSPECSLAAYVDAPLGTFLFVSVWVKPISLGAGEYKYVRRLPPIFDWARQEAGSLPCVIAGDFNCNGSFAGGKGREFRKLAADWKKSHGICSAWHQRQNFPMSEGEEPTWIPFKQNIPECMLDYIFVPTAWTVDVCRIQEPYGSDNRPLIVKVSVG
jgi:endonuclease/exonuclease/phosphatase family metal-dependent hydrolase